MNIPKIVNKILFLKRQLENILRSRRIEGMYGQ
jgi:hypothetical protein